MPPALDQFIIDLGIRVAPNQGVDQFIKQLTMIQKWGQAYGKSLIEIENLQNNLLQQDRRLYNARTNTFTQLGDSIKQAYAAQHSKRDQEEKYREDGRQRQRVRMLSGIANPFSFISPTSGIRVQQLLSNVSRVIPKLQGFAFMFQAAKGAWDFGEAIANLNTKILQLGETSGLGAQKLQDLGAAVTAFGGSAESVAAGNERSVLQIEKMKRGGGLGYLGDVAYKYGFSVDMSADWETNNQAAIAYARTLSKNARMAFLKEWDPSNFTSNMLKASMSAEQVSEHEAFFKSYEDVGDVEKVTEETQKFNMETAKLRRAWTAITNQLAAALLPVMTKLANFATKIADTIAKSPGILKTILVALGAIIGATTTAVASGNWVAAALAGGMIGLGIAGVVAGTSSIGKPSNAKSETVENEVYIKDLVSGKATLTGRENFLLDEQDKRFKEYVSGAQNAEQAETPVAENTMQLVDGFGRLIRVVDQTTDSMKKVADEAMSLQEAERIANAMATSNYVSNLANSNSSSNVEVHVEQTFNEADTSEIRGGFYDLESEISKSLAQASRRFNN